MKKINKYIDQTILKPDAAKDDILVFIDSVKKYRFYAAVVNPCWVELLHSALPEEIKVCSVVGFPLGASSTKVKVYAALDLIDKGCDEIDVVMNIGRFKSRDYKYVGKEIKAVVNAAQGRIVKVIIETCLLDDAEKKAAARIIMESGAKFVKTSTGFSKQGATIEDVRLLKQTVGDKLHIKASGGIRDLETVKALLKAGADRIGTSAGVKIMEQSLKIH
ncbi:MAG TPA: deoxyribose-phosphate aldolase [candidate division WOR-3 bacterium]|uniref:Deoxyribose-phosphate aldolase n=1 Tax=candidate division WOR-3 bacterium TaxID=2052148 RepID=A0A9C9ENV4_UNCW3|nr:deoxyribose-phosphate aldolase [candidate division WOR-3 bacterium]